ncbi:MAG: FAD-binding oxidoreductase, partial [Acidimicrobiia bacterium]|nr:FAD-binding oxidoreductase [Acidimicrobiia bacterium]
MSERRRSWWGWGWEDEALSADQVASLGAAVASRLGLADVSARPAPSLASLDLPPPRLAPPATLADICSSDVEARASHTYGKSFRDVVRAFSGQLSTPPDVVARPRDEADIVDLLDWC